MLNIIIPMGGVSSLSSELEYSYPSPLIEIAGRPLIEHVIENLGSIGSELKFTVILRDEDCRRFHLDNTVQLLTNQRANVLRLKAETAGALCSVLLALEEFANSDPVVIANSDQIFDIKTLKLVIADIERAKPDAACPVFDSVHPRWSYVRIHNDMVVEAAEKNPISRNAVAGLYYFRNGQHFADLAMRAILNGRQTEGKYYTSAVINEYILAGLRVLPVRISNDGYHSLFTAQRLGDYERFLRAGKRVESD